MLHEQGVTEITTARVDLTAFNKGYSAFVKCCNRAMETVQLLNFCYIT